MWSNRDRKTLVTELPKSDDSSIILQEDLEYFRKRVAYFPHTQKAEEQFNILSQALEEFRRNNK